MNLIRKDAHILIADDVNPNLFLLQKILSKQGYQISLAHNGLEAIENTKKLLPDLILLDVMMPKLNGFETCKQLKLEKEFKNIPVIFLTAKTDRDNLVRGFNAGAVDYVTKPFDAVELLARVETHLRLRQTQKALERRSKQLQTRQTQMIRSAKMASLGKLTSGIAHEIRNPLNFVSNFSEICLDLIQEQGELQKDLTSKNLEYIEENHQQLDKMLKGIHSHGQRIEKVVKSMLLYSGPHSGQRELCDVNGVLKEHVTFAFHNIHEDSVAKVKIEENYEEGLEHAKVIPAEISRALTSIVNNSFYELTHPKAIKKFSSDEVPTLWITTKLISGKRIEVRIKDNGNGIEEDILHEIFSPFFTTKPTGVGVGLGLSIAFDIIVIAHFGELFVETELGKFTEFIIRFPLTPPS